MILDLEIIESTQAHLYPLHTPQHNPQQDVSKILEKCGDIDDAIRQLTTLRLQGAGRSGDQTARGESEKNESKDEETTADAGASTSGCAGPSTEQLNAAEAEARVASAAAASAARLATEAPTTLTREWIEALVREMTSAADVNDAHQRAERVLTAFEATVKQNVVGGAGEGAGTAGDTQNLVKENVILKRAVAIQNQRLEEHEVTKNQIVELQRMVLSYQERLQNAERQNYSLGVHLKEAMGVQSPGMFDRNPDVF